MSLSQVQIHMRREDAPKWKKKGKLFVYRWSEAEPFLKSVTKWARGGLSGDAQTMKDQMIALDLEAKREAAAIRRGELVNKKAMAEAITSLGRGLFAMVKRHYVDELPSKYQGKNEVECRFLNETAFNEIAVAFRTGMGEVEKTTGNGEAA